jgi:ATP-binding cassette subfamily F protein 3
VEQEILYAHPDVDSQMARNICGAMMFEDDGALKKVSVLSGGEKSRVMLGKLLATPVNLLLLDEPTNHLDMESSDALLAALDDFPGAVILVTHNEMLLHALAERLIVFQGETAQVFEGSYQQFLERCGWGDEDDLSAAGKKPEDDGARAEKLTKKDIRRIRSDFFNERSRVLKPLEDRIASLEQEIEARERELNASAGAMQQASQARHAADITRISQTMHACQTAIERLFTELEHSTAAYDEQKAVFDKRLEELERIV